MKQKDILLIGIVIILSVAVSLVVSKTFLNSPKKRQQTVEKVDAITADFPSPDKTYFNTSSIDPTALIRIGDKTNPAPFNGSQ